MRGGSGLVGDGWMDVEGTRLQHRAESLMQTLLRHRVWRGKGALFAFKRSKSL